MIFNNIKNFETNQQNRLKSYKAKIETCCSLLQQNLQCSFNRIDNFLDQTIDDIEKLFNQRFQQQQQSKDAQQNNSLPQLQSQVDYCSFFTTLSESSFQDQSSILSLPLNELNCDFNFQKIFLYLYRLILFIFQLLNYVSKVFFTISPFLVEFDFQ